MNSRNKFRNFHNERQNNGYQGGGGNNSNNRSMTSKQNKHSGCSSLTPYKNAEGKEGMYLNGWRLVDGRGNGLMKAFCFDYKGTEDTNTSKTGKNYRKMMCKITYQNSGVEKLYPVLYCYETGNVILSELGLMLSSKAHNGGYFGKVPPKGGFKDNQY